jgi:hypothetical protein
VVALASGERPEEGPVKRTAVIVALVALAACASEPERPLSGKEALDRSLADVREVLETRALGDGSLAPDAREVEVTPELVKWLGPDDARRTLRWDDVEDVDAQEQPEKPSRPETVYLYLARGSRSVDAAKAECPPLSGAGVVRCYVALRDRPRGSRFRVARALELFHRKSPAAHTAAPTAAPVASGSATVEARLRQLKDWHEKGLIDDEVYREEQRKALGGN